jgi:hypothetical protein
MRRDVRAALWAIAIGTLPVWALLWHAEAVLLALGQEARLAALAGEYVRALMWGMPCFCAFVALRGFLAAEQRPGAALLVSLGLGAALAGLVSAVPALVWVSEYKAPVFGVAALLLAGAGALQWHLRTAPCPVDPALRQACLRTRRWSRWVWAAAVGLFAVGAFFAFVAPLWMQG